MSVSNVASRSFRRPFLRLLNNARYNNSHRVAVLPTLRVAVSGYYQIHRSFGSVQERFFSSSSAADHDDTDGDGPTGDLFGPKEIGSSLVGRTGSIHRTFGPRANSEVMLTCGGEPLAAQASFDPDYGRAQGWIRHHAVGPAVLSPILISGLTQALVEAAFPESVPDSQSMKQLRPLIVGVEINATIEVTDVLDNRSGETNDDEEEATSSTKESSNEVSSELKYGYKVKLKTTVTRNRDNLVIAEGFHSIWIPDYLRM